MKLKDVYAVLHGSINGERIRENAVQYRQFPLQLSYSAYGKGIEWLADKYRALGLETEVLHFPADGRTVYADRHFPLAWDVEAAWAKCGDECIADYEADHYSVVPFSAGSDGVRNGVVVPMDKVPEEGALDNIVPLNIGEPSGAKIAELMARGCRAFLVAMDTHPIHPSLEDSRRWFNAAFGGGQIDFRDKACSGFSITPRTARALTERFNESGPVPIQYMMKTKVYSGDAPAVTAYIPGKSKDCFLITSHGYEPHGTNNVAGVAAALEMAEALSGLIREGKLPKPKYSIRFFHGLENFSLYAWGIKNPELMKNAVGGVSLDSFGRLEAEGKREHFVLRQSMNVHPSPQHGIAKELLGLACGDSGIGFERKEASKNNEDLMQDPMFGPAWNLLYGSLWEEPLETYPRCYFYHTNIDTPEKLSPVALKTAADFAASLAFFCAQDDLKQQEETAEIALADWKAAADEKCRQALMLEDNEQDARMRRAQRLAAWRNLSCQSAAKAIPEQDKAAEAVTYIKSRTAAAIMLLNGTEPPPVKSREYGDVLERTVPGPVGLGLIDDELRKLAVKTLGYFANEYWCLDESGTNYYHFDGVKTVWQIAVAVWATRPYGPHETPNDFKIELDRYAGLAKIIVPAGLAKIKPPVTVTAEDIKAGLSRLGIAAGDTVIVHSSFKALGNVPGGPMTVVNALKDAITENGILAMPALVACAVGAGSEPFNKETSAIEPWMGIIPETFRKSEGVLRSSCPTHSVCAWGKNAADFIASSEPLNVFADDSPWAKLRDNGGKILFIGESVGGNTFLHATESWHLGYLDETIARVQKADGTVENVLVTNYPGGCRGGWYGKGRKAAYYKKLEEMGVPHCTTVGNAVLTVMDAKELYEAMGRIFAEDPGILLHKSGCSDCARILAKCLSKK